jgi:hypothetical protein
MANKTPTPKKVKASSVKRAIPKSCLSKTVDVYFTVELGAVGYGNKVEVRFNADRDFVQSGAPTISFGNDCEPSIFGYPSYSCEEILELAEVVRVLPKLKLDIVV